jgi:hypothetical protein
VFGGKGRTAVMVIRHAEPQRWQRSTPDYRLHNALEVTMTDGMREQRWLTVAAAP